jgi:hypothetical protein
LVQDLTQQEKNEMLKKRDAETSSA